MLNYKQDGDKATFDLYMFPLALIPQLVRQLNHHLFMEAGEASRMHFRDERHIYAERAGLSAEKQLSLNLKLKNY